MTLTPIPVAQPEDFRDLAEWIASLPKKSRKYSPDQPRDERGRFGETEGGGSSDAVPPLPGETPIPEGAVRLFHRTPITNAESIRANGLQVSSARGESYGEPNMVWGSAGIRSSQARDVSEGGIMDSQYVVVEFWAMPEELDIGHFSTAEELEARQSDVTMYHSVPPEQIVAIHEPWHAAYRYLSDYTEEVRAGEYDFAALDNENYARAIDAIKAGKSKDFTEHLHPRDEHGRFAEVPGTTPENYRETWKPVMTPEEGHAWAKAAGTKYEATVVHMTSKDAVDAIRGRGFNIEVGGESTRVAHEAGAYFATDTQSAAFYEYKGDQAVSAVIVLQKPLMMDWSHPETLDRETLYGQAALEGAFREAALLAAGLDADTRVYDANDNEYYASESPEDCTQALRDAGYDGVIINAESADTNPSVGGPQVITFDREQAIVIGTEVIPGAGAEQQMWDEYYASLDTDHPLERPDEAAINRAFAKEFTEHLHPRHPAGTPGGVGGQFVSGGGGFSVVSAGETPEGRQNSANLFSEFRDLIEQAPEKAGPRSAEANAKRANVERIGAALAERAKGDPELRAELDRAGMRVYSTTRIGGSGELTPYITDHLGVTDPNTSTVEIGAREVAAKMQDAWMQSATDRSDLTWAMQVAAAERLGIDTSEADQAVRGTGVMGDEVEKALGIDTGPGVPNRDLLQNTPAGQDAVDRVHYLAESGPVKAYVDEVYTETQTYLADHGITELSLDRGVSFRAEPNDDPFWDVTEPVVEEVMLNPLSSCALVPDSALDFATSQSDETGSHNGYVLTLTVPAERVFSLPPTGPGCLWESEAIIVGGPTEAHIEPQEGNDKYPMEALHELWPGGFNPE